METTPFETVVALAKELNEAELLRLREYLDVWLQSQGAVLTEDEVDQEMFADGILDHLPPPLDAISPCPERPLIEIQGKPLSETIMEERR